MLGMNLKDIFRNDDGITTNLQKGPTKYLPILKFRIK